MIGLIKDFLSQDIVMNQSITNLLTIDIEDWFHTSALAPYIDQDQWGCLESRVVRNVHLLLNLFAAHQTRATFFILGWIAERYPDLVKEIDAHGHEIASHGYRHRLIYQLTPGQFQDYLERAKNILEDLLGHPIRGYRATSFSITKESWWALDLIQAAGFAYDSSIFPIGYHDLYGIAGLPRSLYAHGNGLVEIPPSTLRLWGQNIPFGGGGYFRLYPYWVTRWGIRQLNREGLPALIYLHPWELDPDCPRVAQADGRTRFRQYVNLRQTAPRLTRLLEDFSWSPVWDYVRRGQGDGALPGHSWTSLPCQAGFPGPRPPQSQPDDQARVQRSKA
jgi:polysaccharide deacetylase family protein (PEP-CTERM system associated)